jgi:hypothetical protein
MTALTARRVPGRCPTRRPVGLRSAPDRRQYHRGSGRRHNRRGSTPRRKFFSDSSQRGPGGVTELCCKKDLARRGTWYPRTWEAQGRGTRDRRPDGQGVLAGAAPTCFRPRDRQRATANPPSPRPASANINRCIDETPECWKSNRARLRGANWRSGEGGEWNIDGRAE